MKHLIALILALGLTACGVDGEPVTPKLSAGVSVGPNGVNTNAGVRIRKGPFSAGWNLF